jgi:hypothetical protein
MSLHGWTTDAAAGGHTPSTREIDTVPLPFGQAILLSRPGALIFGQFASGHACSVLGLVLGLMTTRALYVVAHLFYRVARRREHT